MTPRAVLERVVACYDHWFQGPWTPEHIARWDALGRAVDESRHVLSHPGGSTYVLALFEIAGVWMALASLEGVQVGDPRHTSALIFLQSAVESARRVLVRDATP